MYFILELKINICICRKKIFSDIYSISDGYNDDVF